VIFAANYWEFLRAASFKATRRAGFSLIATGKT
jgi:hypothetical protein